MKLDKLKKDLEKAKEELAELRGKRMAEMESLKAEGCRSTKEAEKLAVKERSNADKMQKVLEEKLAKLEKLQW